MQKAIGEGQGGFVKRAVDRLGIDPKRVRTAQRLMPYVWPADRPDLQRIVLLSLGLMLVAKIVTVLMPFTFKWATDGWWRRPAAVSGVETIGVVYRSSRRCHDPVWPRRASP